MKWKTAVILGLFLARFLRMLCGLIKAFPLKFLFCFCNKISYF